MSEPTKDSDDQVTVSKKYLAELQAQGRWLRALERGGVDNWEFYGEVRQQHRQDEIYNGDEDE